MWWLREVSNRAWTHLKCVLWAGSLWLWPPPCICLTRRGLAVSAPTPVHHFTIIIFTLKWKKAEKKRYVDWQLHFKDLPSRFSRVVGVWVGERPRLRQPAMLWGQFRWLALKCKLKRVSLCSLKWPVPGNIMKNYPQPVCVVSNVVTGKNC